MRPKARARSSAVVEMPTPLAEVALDGRPPAAASMQTCAHCHRHLAPKHDAQPATVWGLANRPLRVLLCADCRSGNEAEAASRWAH